MVYMDKIKRSTEARRNLRGAAVVEFALLLFLLLIIVAGIVEFGRTFWYFDALTKATRDGARYLSNARESTTVALNSTFEDKAIAMVENAADLARVPGFLATDVTVICDYDSSTGNGTKCSTENYIPDYVTVSIGYPVQIGLWIPFVTLVGAPWDATLSPSTTMRYMCDEPESC